MELEWMTPQQVAEQWGVQARQVQLLCSQGRIAGVVRLGRTWLIPKNAERPIDGRTHAAKQLKKDNNNDSK
jgi:excisionase family DNA binding protein